MRHSRSARPLGLAAALLTLPVPAAQNWYVDVQSPLCPTGTGGPLDPFCDIASALQAAQSGDTIFIAPGTYPESLIVGKSVALIGTGGAPVTVVDANQHASVLQVNAGVTASVDGLTLTDGRGLFGGGVNNAGTLTLTNSTISDSWGTGDGGGVFNTGGLTLTDCSLTGNLSYGYSGGGILNRSTGTVNMTGCRITGNDAYYYGGGIRNNGSMVMADTIVSGNCTYLYEGGGIYNQGTLVMTYSTVVDNDAGGLGGGILNRGPALLVNCTIAGNQVVCASGGVENCYFGTFTATHTIIAGNVAPCISPDFGGTFSSAGYNVLGNTSGTIVTGDPTGNLLDVDPGFASAAAGDYRLGPSSPARDAGSLLRTDACLFDLDGNLRILDGDLDGSAVIDPGAYEFAHVRLDVQGPATPGGTLVLNGSGTAGLATFLWLGLGSSQLVLPRFGCLFVDLTAPRFLVPLGPMPVPTLVGTLPPDLPTGTVLAFQLIVVTVGAGNLSNPVVLTVL